MKDQSNAYANRITAAYNAQATLSGMYATSGNTLSDQLKIVARLIGGGLSTLFTLLITPTVLIHILARWLGSPTTGNHANMLSKLSVAIAAFQNDITLMGVANRVTGMTFSEFGRRVINNTSNGTDHGSGAPVIFFGEGILGGVTGTSPVLPANQLRQPRCRCSTISGNYTLPLCKMAMHGCQIQSQTILNGTYSLVPIFNGLPLAQDGIELLASWNNGYAKLEFEVFENEVYDHFIIERSVNGNSFQPVDTVMNVSNASRENYVFNDPRINAPELFYRIKGITRQGAAKLSEIVKLKNNDKQELRVYPNPVTNFTINIEFLRILMKLSVLRSLVH